MHEFNHCRAIAKTAWELVVQQPALCLVALLSIVPAAAAFLLIQWTAPSNNTRLFILALSTAMYTFFRIAFSHAVYAALKNEPWNARTVLLAGLRQWKNALLFGLLDVVCTVLCGLILVYIAFGSIAASLWWCMSALVPCVLAAGYMELSRAIVRAERVFAMIRMELLIAALILSLSMSFLLSVLEHLGLPRLIGFELFIILVAIPARELAWQLFVSVAYYHNAPAPY